MRTSGTTGTVQAAVVNPPPPIIEKPVVTMVLTPDSISENGGVSTVTATVSPTSSEAFTVTVSASAVSPAVAGDFMRAGATLSFAANATGSTGLVTITAVNNDNEAANKSITVSGTVSLLEADDPVDVTLTITDDDGQTLFIPPKTESPVVTLLLTPQMISENGGVSTVTAIVSPSSLEAFTVTVSAGAVSPAVAGDFNIAGTTLSFAANATKSTGGVTITAVDNVVDAPDKMVRVSGTVSLSGAVAPVDVTLIITDDEEQPTDPPVDPPETESPVVTLLLTPQMISEDEGVSTVTAMVSPASSEAFTVSVSASAVSPAVAGDFMLTGTTLSFAANATKSTGGVTITAVDNAVDAPDKMVRVSGTVSLSETDAPTDVTLIITDDEEQPTDPPKTETPVVTLLLTPQMISEDGGVSTVTAIVSPASSEAFTVTVSTSAVSPAVAGDFMLTGTTLSFAANATKSTGEVTISAVDNVVDAPDKMVRVSGTVSLTETDAPVDVTLIITDDEEQPTDPPKTETPVITLLLTPQMISEDGGVSTVTAIVSPSSLEAFTVTVSAGAVSPAVAGDFNIAGTTLSFAANATKSTGGVTITAVDNAVDAPDKMVRVSGTVSLSETDAPDGRDFDNHRRRRATD